LILVLVVEESGGQREHETIARVCRDYDVATAGELEEDVRRAAWQAGNQVTPRSASPGLALDRDRS
jgi:hypothetical protein